MFYHKCHTHAHFQMKARWRMHLHVVCVLPYSDVWCIHLHVHTPRCTLNNCIPSLILSIFYNHNTFKFIFINLIIFDKCYYVLLYFQYSLSNVIDILANNECPFLRHSCFPKKGFAIFGGWPRRGWGPKACPKIGVSCFRKITFAVFGGWPRRGAKWADSCPKNGVSCFPKKGFAEKGT